jgi:uncharacterized protein (DUF362 family)
MGRIDSVHNLLRSQKTGRRKFLHESAILAGMATLKWPSLALAHATPSTGSQSKWTPPGPFPGRVVEVQNPASIVNSSVNAETVRFMVDRGLKELVGSDHPVEAWRYFFQRGDVVGIKVNPVGNPHVISSPAIIHAIVRGLEQAGVKRNDVLVFERYRDQFIEAGYPKSIPEGVRWDAAVEKFDEIQTDLKGYDPAAYVQLPLIIPGQDPEKPANLQSHALLLLRQVNKVISIPCLKDHTIGGVTLALKQLSHGFVNNVSRSHATTTLVGIVAFTPGVVSMPTIRSKVVLHILDGLKGCFQGGPGVSNPKNTWEARTLWFATDPVAMDRMGWDAIDAKRAQEGLAPVALAPPSQNEGFIQRQPQYIEACGAIGLGVYHREKIDLRRIAAS